MGPFIEQRTTTPTRSSRYCVARTGMITILKLKKYINLTSIKLTFCLSTLCILGLLWTSDQPDAETSIKQRTTPTRDRRP